jgi:hypothetical protein
MTDLARVARRRGISSEHRWSEAVRPGQRPITTATPPEKRPHGCVLWPSNSADNRAWRIATDETKAA